MLGAPALQRSSRASGEIIRLVVWHCGGVVRCGGEHPAKPEQGRKPRNGWSGRGLIVAHRPRALLLALVAAPIPTPIGHGPRFTPPRVGPQRPPAVACSVGAAPAS